MISTYLMYRNQNGSCNFHILYMHTSQNNVIIISSHDMTEFAFDKIQRNGGSILPVDLKESNGHLGTYGGSLVIYEGIVEHEENTKLCIGIVKHT